MTLDRFGGCVRYRKDYPPIGVGVQIIKAYFGIKDSGGGNGGNSGQSSGGAAAKPKTFEEAKNEALTFLDEMVAAGFKVGM